MSNPPNPKPSLLLALVVVGAGLLLGLIGFRLAGGIVAGAGVIPSCYAAWIGMQQETQGSLAKAIGMVFLSLGVGAVLLVWALVGSIGSLF